MDTFEDFNFKVPSLWEAPGRNKLHHHSHHQHPPCIVITMPSDHPQLQPSPPEKPAHYGSITSVNTPKLETTRRALFRQPLALQWLEDGQLKKRKEGERQAGMQKKDRASIPKPD
jgi:hypothetical protein